MPIEGKFRLVSDFNFSAATVCDIAQIQAAITIDCPVSCICATDHKVSIDCFQVVFHNIRFRNKFIYKWHLRFPAWLKFVVKSYFYEPETAADSFFTSAFGSSRLVK
ncbi:hypothetical protein CFBP498_38650 [Xanthomonas hortorum pv. vitians]|uniref:Uncharacterized protein n=1 Tax=Xanthomonas hortorum pv. vitians TaxID=83224 RepID=A0A6V7ERC5_9XANT|nr:hypothetical protein CFBP498_38650 [Xanthomonas hortorum pv. vitians]CAD0353827.1 hypothetical protein CFBP498_38650 [Xanthomonas hortorum pv. vitians]